MLPIYVIVTVLGLVMLINHSCDNPFARENRATVFRQWFFDLGLVLWGVFGALEEVIRSEPAHHNLKVLHIIAATATILCLVWKRNLLARASR